MFLHGPGHAKCFGFWKWRFRDGRQDFRRCTSRLQRYRLELRGISEIGTFMGLAKTERWAFLKRGRPRMALTRRMGMQNERIQLPDTPRFFVPTVRPGLHLFEYRLVSRIIGFEFKGPLYRRLGFGNTA
jgi:hypothetical protein